FPDRDVPSALVVTYILNEIKMEQDNNDPQKAEARYRSVRNRVATFGAAARADWSPSTTSRRCTT
ncbi:MAG: hypothetical protein P4M11_13065, partial [Candidatus Pacebacteria bacterium]|nr:hypothetical protein [Candidatus Paceibacterota bacterium]